MRFLFFESHKNSIHIYSKKRNNHALSQAHTTQAHDRPIKFLSHFLKCGQQE